jgi:hypothetical protein
MPYRIKILGGKAREQRECDRSPQGPWILRIIMDKSIIICQSEKNELQAVIKCIFS